MLLFQLMATGVHGPPIQNVLLSMQEMDTVDRRERGNVIAQASLMVDFRALEVVFKRNLVSLVQ